jgi:central kinetochore subunit Mis15/CHL4
MELDDEKAEKENLGMKRKRVEDESVVKRRKLVAKGRFGNSAKVDDGKGIERLDVRLEDLFPSAEAMDDDVVVAGEVDKTKKKGRRSTICLELDRTEGEDIPSDGWRPDIRVTFHGQHIFAGIRQLVETGVIDGEKMPGWMTGEEGVSVGVVRDGRIRGYKGSGM